MKIYSILFIYFIFLCIVLPEWFEPVCIYNFPWINWTFTYSLLLQLCWLKMENFFFRQRGLEEPHAQNMLSLWMLITYLDQVALILASWGRLNTYLHFSS